MVEEDNSKTLDVGMADAMFPGKMPTSWALSINRGKSI